MARLLADADAPMRADDDKSFELDSWIDTAPFEDLVGIRIESAESGRAILDVPFKVKLAQGGGMLHGGALTTLADTAVAMAVKSLLPPGTVFATTELSMQFTAPVREGRVRAVAAADGPAGRTFKGRCDLYDGDDILVGRFTSTFRVARNQGFDE